MSAKKSIDELRKEARELMARLREERDELHLQIHLAKAEARDEWEKLEPSWEEFQARVHAVAETAGDASKDVYSALGLLGDELRHGYDRIRKAMRS